MFKSFVWGGFECCFAETEPGKRMDLLAATKHDIYCREDYKLLKNLRIYTVREGLAWSQIDKGRGEYDFSRFETMMHIGKEEEIEQIWDLNHFDYPNYLDPFSAQFVTAFGEYAKKAMAVIRKYNSGTIYICPVNEISFWSLIGADWGKWAPFAKNKGYEFKKQLVEAAITAMDAIWSVDKNVRFIHVDPIMRRVPKNPLSLKQKEIAAGFIDAKFQAWDMLSGKLEPELGGGKQYLDILGANYYIYNQEWVVENKRTGEIKYESIPWRGKGRVGIGEMMKEMYERYKRPMVVSETGAWGILRPRWWRKTLLETKEAVSQLPIYGVCAYPAIDRPDWDDGHLTNSGLWDFLSDDLELKRVPHDKTIKLIKRFIYNQPTIISPNDERITDDIGIRLGDS